jgi:hypothetical protein
MGLYVYRNVVPRQGLCKHFPAKLKELLEELFYMLPLSSQLKVGDNFFEEFLVYTCVIH